MRRQLLTLALAGVLGALLVSDARACHKAKCPHKCAPAAPVCAEPCPPPCPPPAPVCAEPVAKKSCQPHFKLSCHLPKIHMGGFCHKKAACPEPAPVCESAPAPYATAQVVPSAQVQPSGQ
jgi:hypothetical protein